MQVMCQAAEETELTIVPVAVVYIDKSQYQSRSIGFVCATVADINAEVRVSVKLVMTEVERQLRVMSNNAPDCSSHSLKALPTALFSLLLFTPPLLLHITAYLAGAFARRVFVPPGETEGEAQFKAILGGLGIGAGLGAVVDSALENG
ncbi:hypothetical protein DXG03_006331 [Asterophora parasitica]|uniref:Uncharacterized protein n=1 Tax=Asterophora parasitica TaxID=117018 RepID=A0A9P7GAX1_9AGAR|nr:hypothetical protein DXG03_006331 [Asterophora parasitica]